MKKIRSRAKLFHGNSATGNRWKWMATSSAAFGAAASGPAMAAPAQINLVGNEVSLFSNNISADITGDGIDDLPQLNVFQRLSSVSSFSTNGKFYYRGWNRVAVNSGTGIAKSNSFQGTRFGIASFFISFSSNLARTSRFGSNSPNVYYAYAGSQLVQSGSSPQSATGLIPVSFSDARINSGAPTSGVLEVRAFNAGGLVNHTVQLLRVTYDDVNATLRVSIRSKIKKLKKKLKRAKKAGKVAKAKKLKKKIKKLKQELRSLS